MARRDVPGAPRGGLDRRCGGRAGGLRWSVVPCHRSYETWCGGAPEALLGRSLRAYAALQMSTSEGPGTRTRVVRRARPLIAVTTLALLLSLVALPTLAADPSAPPESPGVSHDATGSAAPSAAAEPGTSAEPSASAVPEDTDEPDEAAAPQKQQAPAEGKPDKPDKGPKEHEDKTPEEQITISGTVTTGTGDEGESGYQMSSGGKTYQLDAGPPWFYGDSHPLKPYVGKSVTIVGEIEQGSTEVDVLSVDGK